MNSVQTRPTFDEAREFFLSELKRRGMSTQLRWAFRENLCLGGVENGQFRFLFNPQAKEVSEERIARRFDQLREQPEILGLVVICPLRDGILAALVGDDWDIDEDEGDIVRTDWSLHFGFRGLGGSCIEAMDTWRWRWRRFMGFVLQNPSPLDFIYLAEDCTRCETAREARERRD